MSILMFFVDGVGIGEPDPSVNPFARLVDGPLAALDPNSSGRTCADGVACFALDAHLGITTLPQSATGQTALFTGVNAPQRLGRHLSGFPTVTLRKILAEHSLFRCLKETGRVGTFANALSPQYFARGERRISATTWALLAGGFGPRQIIPDIHQRRAVCHDLTNEFLRKLGYQVPVWTPGETGRILADLLEEVDFVLFEHLLLDVAGHAKDWDRARQEIDKLQECLQALLDRVDLQRHQVWLVSDHGNAEDLTVATHTHNPVPLLIWTQTPLLVGLELASLVDVAAALLRVLG